MRPSADQITDLLRSWSEGDERALDHLMPLIYDELHRLARRYLSRERPGHTLQTTALVNEAYLRLADSTRADWKSRAHFFAVCARVMRRILVDWARSRKAQRRGGDLPALQVNDALVAAAEPGYIVAIDDALRALEAVDPRKSRVVELRFFGGLSVKEVAETLDVSAETVQRDWRMAKSWLRRELR